MTIRLTDPSADRYQRLRLIRWWDQEKLQSSKAIVVGAGALGNEVVKNLALLGAGEILILDFDKIETSNLTRSALFRMTDVGKWKAEVLAEQAAALNPDCKVQGFRWDVRHDLGFHLIRNTDVVFGCVDNREARYYVNRYCYLMKKPFIDGGLDALNGSVHIFRPPETACYECTLSSTDRAELQKRISCLKSIEPEIKHHVPTAPTIASIIGGLQAQIGVRLIHGLDVPSGKRIGLYGLSDVFFDIRLEVSADCGMHGSVDPLPEQILSLDASETDSLSRILELAKSEWGAEMLTWDFDRDLITALHCTSCGTSREFVGTGSLYEGSPACGCGGMFKPEITSTFAGREFWGAKSFRELGFPRDHIYCATSNGQRTYFHLKLKG